MSTPDPLERLQLFRRTPFAHIPTPLVRARRLEAAVGKRCPELWLKMDAWTGFGLGGNKVRKLEFELNPDRLAGVTHLVTTGGPQSNHCRVTAAAASRLGLGCTLVVNGEPASPIGGNALLHRLLGAEVRTIGSRAERPEAMARVAQEVAEAGGRALVVPLGASTPHGTLGYARAAAEIRGQLREIPDPGGDTIVALSASSGGTLAGLVLGAELLGWDVRFLGVSPDDPAEEVRSAVLRLVEEGGRLLDFEGSPRQPEVEVTDAFVGEGYGIPSPEGREALELFARAEGIVLDPTYTAKAAAGLLDALRGGRYAPDDRVIFIHTGGAPALFA